MKFQTGDKVVAINTYKTVSEGKLYTVKGSTRNLKPAILSLEEEPSFFLASNFVPMEDWLIANCLLNEAKKIII